MTNGYITVVAILQSEHFVEMFFCIKIILVYEFINSKQRKISELTILH